MKKSQSRPAAFFYVPDHIRLQRSDRLWHVRDSLLLLFQRNMLAAWDNAAAYHFCQQMRHEIAVIDQVLKERWLKIPRFQRQGKDQETEQRYLMAR